MVARVKHAVACACTHECLRIRTSIAARVGGGVGGGAGWRWRCGSGGVELIIWNGFVKSCNQTTDFLRASLAGCMRFGCGGLGCRPLAWCLFAFALAK